MCLLLAACAFLGWLVPASWFPGLIAVGAIGSIILQVVWISGWAVLPIAIDAALLWMVLGLHLTAGGRPRRTRLPAERAQ